MPAATTVSDKKLAANRANAQHSTGPRTPAGKRRSSKNATTHALFCQDLLHDSESPDLFHALRHALLEELNPQTALELALVDRVLAAQWRLRRCLTAEARLLDLADADLAADLDDHNTHAAQLRSRLAERDADDPTAALADHPDLDPIDPFDRPLSPGLHLARALHASATSTDPARRNRTTPFERLVATEQRLQGMLHRALKELRACQAARRARVADRDHDADPPCPFLPDTPPSTPSRRATAPTQPDTTPFTQPQPAPELQNEPTPSSPSVSSVPSVVNPSSPPAQNEPTKHKGQRTNDPLDIPLPPHEDTPSHQTPTPFPEYHPPYAP